MKYLISTIRNITFTLTLEKFACENSHLFEYEFNFRYKFEAFKYRFHIYFQLYIYIGICNIKFKNICFKNLFNDIKLNGIKFHTN